MRFNGDANGQDIVTLINDYCNTNNIVFTLAEKARYVNIDGSKIWSEIFSTYSGWQYDDQRQVNLPEDVQNLTNGVSDYTIPTNSLTILGVDIRTNGSAVNKWTKIEPLSKEEIRQHGLSDTALSVTNNIPVGYIMIKDKIRLIPAPNYTQTASLRVSYDRGSVAFLPTDTTAEPGFASEFHYGLALGASLEWALRNSTSVLPSLQDQYNQFVIKLRKFYTMRFKDNASVKITFKDNSSEYL